MTPQLFETALGTFVVGVMVGVVCRPTRHKRRKTGLPIPPSARSGVRPPELARIDKAARALARRDPGPPPNQGGGGQRDDADTRRCPFRREPDSCLTYATCCALGCARFHRMNREQQT